MPTLDWHLRRKDGITLVELLVTSERNCEIRLESELQPVWPPRRQGVPAAGWEDGTFVGELQADGRLVLGYASPAEPVEPPAELQVISGTDADPFSPRELIHALGDPKPPRDAVPAGNTASTALDSKPSPTHPQQTETTDSTAPEGNRCSFSRSNEHDTHQLNDEEPKPQREAVRDSSELTGTLPPMFDSWFGAVESRLAEATQLETQEVQSHPLRRQLLTDRSRLERIKSRHQELASRFDGLDFDGGTDEPT